MQYIWQQLIENKRYPLLSCVNFSVSLCDKEETLELALEVLNDIPVTMRKRGMKTFSDAVQALCSFKDVDAAKKLVLKMIADGPPPRNAVFNFVITGYSVAGEMGQAVEMLRLLESRGLKPDVGKMEEATKILEEAKKNHLKLCPVMYHTLIRGYCRLERFDEALELVYEMKDFGICSLHYCRVLMITRS
jgi:pentatricopeptide repeat protein